MPTPCLPFLRGGRPLKTQMGASRRRSSSCWLRPARSSAGPCARRSSLRTRAPAWRNGTASREVLSDSEIAALWSMTGGGPCRALLILGTSSWPGTKNAQSHRICATKARHRHKSRLPPPVGQGLNSGSLPLAQREQRPGPYRWPTRAGWRSGSWFRLSREETRTRIGSRCAAGGRSSRWPGATSRSTPGRGTELATSGRASR